MYCTALYWLLAAASSALATAHKRQIAATTITDSNGNTIINSGIPADSSISMTEAASSAQTRPPGAESSLAIVIDGSTMYESGDVTAGHGETAGRTGDGTGSVTAETVGTDSSSGWGPRITQAPLLAGGVAALAALAV